MCNIRVLCIDAQPHNNSYDADCKNLKEGENYTIVHKVPYGGVVLSEVATRNPMGWNEDRFVPCSDIDETERIEEVLEQIFVKKEEICSPKI